MECKCSAEMGINMHKQNDITKVSGHRHSGKVQCKASVREPVIAQKISRKLNMTEDIIAKAPVIYGYGDYKVCVENYRNILEYTSELVRIQTKTCKIHIIGSNLVIAYFRVDGMCVIGNLKSIEYH